MDDNRRSWPMSLVARNPWIDCQGYQNVTGVHLIFDDGLLEPALSFGSEDKIRAISAPRANHRLCELVQGEGVTSIKTLRLLYPVPHYDFQSSDFMVETKPTYEDITDAIGRCLSIALMLDLEPTWSWWSREDYRNWHKLFKASIERELERDWSGTDKASSRIGVKIDPPASWDLDVCLKHLSAVKTELDQLCDDPSQHTASKVHYHGRPPHWHTITSNIGVSVSYGLQSALGYKQILEVCANHLPKRFPWLSNV